MALLTIFTIPAAAQGGTAWDGEYYNNTILQAPSVLKRQDSFIAFDWGAGSPASGVNPDNFSVRWGTDPFFQAGTYRFWALADDKVKVTLDFNTPPNVILDTYTNPAVGQIVAVDVTLSQGVHHVQVDYTEDGGNAYVYVTWANLATNPGGPNFPVPPVSLPQAVSGPWTAQYFNNASQFGSPVLIQSEGWPSHDWGFGSPVASISGDNWSARWMSTQTLAAGTYQLSVRVDDGVRVAIDGVYYINEWHSATGQTYTVNVNLFAGTHNFLIDFYEAGGAAFLNYSFTPVNVIVTQPPAPTGAYITVTRAFRLNVRNAPSAVTGTILTKINRNESYGIIGRNGRGTWWQINVNGILGWINASYVMAFNANNIPVTDGTVVSQPVLPTSVVQVACSTAPAPRLNIGRNGRVLQGFDINLRSQPSINGPLLGRVTAWSVFLVVSTARCSEGLNWYQVNFNGTVGWLAEGANGQYWTEPV
jgi:uncharacterized protein YgiM (DUF1202 family)